MNYNNTGKVVMQRFGPMIVILFVFSDRESEGQETSDVRAAVRQLFNDKYSKI